MGNLSSCSQEYEIKIDQLNKQINSLNSIIKSTQDNNIGLKQELKSSNLQIDILEKKNKLLSDKLKHYNSILNNAEFVADNIISSELNCQWMDNSKEKEYLISIIEFVNSSCNDTVNGLSTKNIIKNSMALTKDFDTMHMKLKKLDTIDRLLDEIEYTESNTNSKS